MRKLKDLHLHLPFVTDCSYILLGLLIEKASGISYRDYVRQYIFAPANMLHSEFYRMDVVNKNVAEGCDPLRDEYGTIVAWKKNIYSYPPSDHPMAVRM